MEKAKQEFSIAYALVVGGLIYFLIFNMVALPFKVLGRSLSELGYWWFGVSGCILVFWLLVKQSSLKNRYLNWRVRKKNTWGYTLVLVILVVAQYVYIVSRTAWVAGVTDDAYYIGDVVTSVYTNTIQQYSYMTGKKLSNFLTAYFLQMYPVHSAVVCKLTGLHPLIENKWVLTAFFLILINCVYYLWGKLLFKGNYKKIIGMFLIILWVMYSQRRVTESFAQHYIYRMAEGKNLLVNLIIPFLLYIFARIVKYDGRKADWTALVLTVAASHCLVGSSMFVLPFVLISEYLYLFFIEKKRKIIIPAIAGMLPCIIAVTFYLAGASGLLIISVP